jgi:hypothetical protein
LSCTAVWGRYNNDAAPATNGFLAGNSIINSSPAYVGFGMYASRRLPARIQITTVGAKPAGGYVPWAVDQKVTYAEYLVLPQNCSCTWMAPAAALAQSGLIYTGDPIYRYAIGRVTFPGGIALSRVVMNSNFTLEYLKQSYITGDNLQKEDQATELLVCNSPFQPLGKPIITFPTEACGVWSTVGMTNAVNTNGFSAGISRINNDAWVGRGQQDAQFQVGRYQDEAITGTYTSWNGDKLADYGSEWLIVPQGCSCEWLTPDMAKIRKGLVTAPDEVYNFGVGRKKFSTGQVSVSRVHYLNTWQWYNELLNYDNAGWAEEMLVCETLPPPPQQCGKLLARPMA